MTEEQRAAAYRQSTAARCQHDAALRAQLRGDPAARAALERKWMPVRDRTPADPAGIDSDDPCDP